MKELDIAALSMSLSAGKAMQQVSVSLTKKAMDFAEVQMQGVVDMMQQAAPAFGHQLDIRV
uniref:Motility protein n=1 Tax=termite gut metagenome TaxID=433724 RepID=S0DDT2_9ZZZZ